MSGWGFGLGPCFHGESVGLLTLGDRALNATMAQRRGSHADLLYRIHLSDNEGASAGLTGHMPNGSMVTGSK
jgi:hypothetical protein